MDKDLLKTIAELDRMTQKNLAAYNDQLQEAIKRHMRGDQLVDLAKLFQEIAAISAAFGVALAAGIVIYNVIAARRAMRTDNAALWRVFKYHGANDNAKVYLTQQAKKVEGLIEKTSLNHKYPGSNLTSGHRIKNIQTGSERVIRNIITVGIRDGKSSWQIAKEIEQYVKPNKRGLRVAPWTITRRELGKPISYIPKGVPAGSVEYNAMRIARTEVASFYQQAPYLAHKDKWYFKGIQWRLSRSHPKIDRCDEYAAHDEGLGIGVWKKCPEIPHPHCLCRTNVLTVPTDEMLEWFKKLNWN